MDLYETPPREHVRLREPRYLLANPSRKTGVAVKDFVCRQGAMLVMSSWWLVQKSQETREAPVYLSKAVAACRLRTPYAGPKRRKASLLALAVLLALW